MDGFAKRRERKKQEILEAALTLFLHYGVQKVAVNEIAASAGVSQVTIYNYFQSKENLASETIKYYVDLTWEDALKVMKSDFPFPEKIKKLIFDKKKMAENINEDFYLYLMKEYTSSSSYMNQFYHQTAVPGFIALIEEGRAQGYVNPNISNEAILFYLQMMQNHIQQEDVYSKILPMTEEIMELFFFGITGKNAAPFS